MSELNYLRVKQLYIEDGVINDGYIAFNQRIVALGPYDQIKHGTPLDISHERLFPGLIDTHAHGAMGCDVMDAKHQSLDTLSKHYAGNGVTGFLATTMTDSPEKICRALQQIHKSKQIGLSGAELLGGYLEGPFFNALYKGAQPEQFFQSISKPLIDQYLAAGSGDITSIAIAPEQRDALTLIPYLKQQGLRVMLGHTNASYEQTIAALAAGADGVVHCFNGMRGLHHREPGTVGAALTCQHCYTELIADGHHVHPAVVNLTYHAKGAEYLNLITDSVPATGLQDGHHTLGNVPVSMIDGVVRTLEGSLAGSTLSLMDAVKNCQQWLDINLSTAIKMASLTPATMLGLDQEIGSIRVGKKANFSAVNTAFNVSKTWVDGRLVFQH